MIESQTIFDGLLKTARELAMTVVTGQLWPPIGGRMWIGKHSLDEILCPNQSERQVAFLIAPGGPGSTFIQTGKRVLNAADLKRLAEEAVAAGGSLTEGRLAVLTPAAWLKRHRPGMYDHRPTILETATAVGWPHNCGDEAVLFLDDQSIYSLMAQVSVGRTVTMLVGALIEPEPLPDQPGMTVHPSLMNLVQGNNHQQPAVLLP